MFSFLQRWFPGENAGAAGKGSPDLDTIIRELASAETPHLKKLEHAAALYSMLSTPEFIKYSESRLPHQEFEKLLSHPFIRYIENARGAELQILCREAMLSLTIHETSLNRGQAVNGLRYYGSLCKNILEEALGGADRPYDEPTFIAYAALKGPQTDGDIQSFMDSVWETNHNDIGARYKVLVSLGSRIADKANHSDYKAVIGAKSQILIDQIAHATEEAVLAFIAQEKEVPEDLMPKFRLVEGVWNIDRIHQLTGQYGLEPYYGLKDGQHCTYLDRLAEKIGERLIELESVRSRLDSERNDSGRRLITERKHLYDDHLFPVLGSGIFGKVLDYIHQHGK